jgi:hypothetical protein
VHHHKKDVYAHVVQEKRTSLDGLPLHRRIPHLIHEEDVRRRGEVDTEGCGWGEGHVSARATRGYQIKALERHPWVVVVPASSVFMRMTRTLSLVLNVVSALARAAGDCSDVSHVR